MTVATEARPTRKRFHRPHKRTLRRQITIAGEIATVPLTQGRFAIMDASDISLIQGFNWFFFSKAYAARHAIVDGKDTCILLHRVVMDAKAGEIVDHISGDTLDNRRCNLRITNERGNSANRRNYKHNFRGVSFDKTCPRNPWKAEMKHLDRHITIGRFATEIEAAIAYDNLAEQVHGEFAGTNKKLGLLK